ncbi:MAG: hypothetical protein MJ224_02770 [archaeon]|nr:hypothetical protein [archaeon]
MKCPYCNSENPDSYKYCHECGCPLNYSNFNPNPNSNSNSNFNNNPHSIFNNYNNSNSYYNNSNLVMSDESKKKLIIFGYIIAILFGWGSFLFSFLFRSFGFYGFFGFFGLFFPGFMLNSNDKTLKKHGIIQLLITLLGIICTILFLFF